MRILSLEMDGYRNLRDLKIDFGDFNILVGRNDSGKSNIVRALDFLMKSLTGDVEDQVPHKGSTNNHRMAFTVLDLVDFRIFHKDKPSEISARLNIELTQTEAESVFGRLRGWNSVTGVVRDKYRLLSIEWKIVGYTFRSQKRLDSYIVEVRAGQGVPIYSTKSVPNGMALSEFDGGMPKISGDFSLIDNPPELPKLLRFMDGVEGSDRLTVVEAERSVISIPREPRGEGTSPSQKTSEGFVGSLRGHATEVTQRKTGLLDDIKNDLISLFPYYSDFDILGDEGRWEYDAFLDGYPSNQIGSGVKQVMECMRAVRSHPSDILVIEEPEVHLHPDKQREFLKYLLENTKGRQVIVTTHSPTIVAESPVDAIRLVRNSASKTEITKITDRDQFSEVVKELGILPRDVFEFESVILVEDDPSELYFEEALRRLRKSSQLPAVIAVHGWTNMNAWANSDVLLRLRKPFIAVFDGDTALDPKKRREKEAYIKRTQMDESKMITLKQPNIEHYIALPTAISRAFPAIGKNNVEQILGDTSRKADLKEEMNRLFLNSLGRKYTISDVETIIKEMTDDEFPTEIKEIVSKS